MEKARETAEARYWFRWHMLLYLIVNAGLVGLWYYVGPSSFFWPFFPIVFWPIGLISHYVAAYRRKFGRRWIANETEKILQKEKEHGGEITV